MINKINSVVFIAVLALSCGCLSYARGITYSVLADRVEDGAVVVVVHLQLEGGMSWYGAGTKEKALLVAARVVRLELAKKGITEYTTSDPSYLEIRQNSHRVGMRIREGSGRLAKSVGQTTHGTVKDDDVAPSKPSQ
jgi:hypothetical protein